MPRTARIVVPGVPHHITQRGNRRMPTFMCDEDYARYRTVLSESCARSDVEIWAYCLMPNHSHTIAVPESEAALRHAFAVAHQKYAREINKRERWRGHLWQCRFASYPMDDAHTLAAARYIELNPVRAGIVSSAAEYQWSSARAHLVGRDDELVRVAPLLAVRHDWAKFINERMDSKVLDALRWHLASGMPLGDEAFVKEIEARLGRLVVAPRAA
ncbi:MAG: transposase [Myxococcales bacterium]|nr:transposase [Myxococcales bacterium]